MPKMSKKEATRILINEVENLVGHERLDDNDPEYLDVIEAIKILSK